MNHLKCIRLLTATALLVVPSLALAAGEGEALYKKTCAMCHGADGSKTVMKNRDLTSAAVQGQSDAQLTEIVTNGKGGIARLRQKAHARPSQGRGGVSADAEEVE